jgi:hypothetical protein
MSIETQHPPLQHARRPISVGLILANFPRRQVPAFKYFLLLLNRLQKTFEFAFYDPPAGHPLIGTAARTGPIDPDRLRPLLLPFEQSLREIAEKRITQFDLARNFPSQLIVVSRARLTNYHYLIREGGVSLLALGEWERSMAPPSAAEFVQLIVLRAAYSATEKGAWNTIHLGTRSCAFDFTRNLQDTRMMTLTGLGTCDDCSHALQSDGFLDAPAELRYVAEKSWLGKRSEPGTPANIMARFGYDLYFTRGFSATFGERFRQLLEEDAAKEFIKLVFLVLGTALLVWWKLKGP